MNKFAMSAIALLLVTTAACGRSDTAQEQKPAVPAAEAKAADPANPFTDAEMAMGQKMMAAVGTDAADNWVRKMIEHHRGAIEMSRIVLQNNPTADVAKMAQDTIDKQTKEIADLQEMVKDGTPDQQSAALYDTSMREMQQAMMAAKGADPSETWMRKMTEHHRGAVTMSDALLKQGGVSADVRRQAQKTRDDQQKELEMMEQMMGGQPMKPASTGNRSADASSSTVAGATASRQASAPSSPPSDAMAGHDMSKMSGSQN